MKKFVLLAVAIAAICLFSGVAYAQAQGLSASSAVVPLSYVEPAAPAYVPPPVQDTFTPIYGWKDVMTTQANTISVQVLDHYDQNGAGQLSPVYRTETRVVYTQVLKPTYVQLNAPSLPPSYLKPGHWHYYYNEYGVYCRRWVDDWPYRW